MTRPRCFRLNVSTSALGLVLGVLALFALEARGGDAVRVVTEELPPYNMTRSGHLTGASTEVVQAVLKEAGIEASIQSMPWARAYDMALNSSDVLIYSIARTPEREKLFKWVGVITPVHWHLYARGDSPILLKTLDDARAYQIATVQQDAGEQYLVGQGFRVGENLQSSTKYAYNYEKLKLGRVDLWISIDLNAQYLVRQAGDDPDKTLRPVLSLPELDGEFGLSIAFSRQTSDERVENLRKALDTLRHNGTLDAILKKWL